MEDVIRLFMEVFSVLIFKMSFNYYEDDYLRDDEDGTGGSGYDSH